MYGRTLALTMLVLLALGCSSSDDPPPAQAAAGGGVGVGQSASFQVGAAGGPVSAFGGEVTLFFPAGALEGDTTITITAIAPPAGSDFVPGSLFDFGPDMDFHQPVDISIGYDPALVGGAVDELRIAKFIAGQPESQRVMVHGRVDAAGRRVHGYVHGFSNIGVAGPLPLSPPRMVTAEVNGDDSVTIEWADLVDSVVIIERARIVGGGACVPHASRPSCIQLADGSHVWNGLQQPTDADFTRYAVRSAVPRSFTDAGPANQGGVYHYRIRAVRGSSQSAPSPATRVVVFGPIVPPAGPSNVTLSTLTCGGVVVRWSSVLTAEEYLVQRKLQADPVASFATVAFIPGTELFHTDTSVVPGESYSYRVLSRNVAGTSSGSAFNVTNATSEFTVGLSAYRLTVASGATATLDIFLMRHGGAGVNIGLALVSDSAHLTATFAPDPTGGNSQATLSVDPAAPAGLRIGARIEGTTVGAGTTCSIPFTVTVLSPVVNLVPTLEELFPSFVATNTPFRVAILGDDFVPGSIVRLDGVDIPTIFGFDGEVFADIPGLAFGAHRIEVFNPPPGGGLSNSLEIFAK